MNDKTGGTLIWCCCHCYGICMVLAPSANVPCPDLQLFFFTIYCLLHIFRIVFDSILQLSEVYAPRYLMDTCSSVAMVPGRQRLRSARRKYLVTKAPACNVRTSLLRHCWTISLE